MCSVQEHFRKLTMHMELMRPFECFVPKHHVMFHAILETMEKGNPWFYGTWMDESLNKILKGTCRNASQITFEMTILLKMRELLGDGRGMKRARSDWTCFDQKMATDACVYVLVCVYIQIYSSTEQLDIRHEWSSVTTTKSFLQPIIVIDEIIHSPQL